MHEISAKSELMDNVIPAGVKIDFIKIDVEGAELQVIRGGIETIRRNRPIIVFEHGLGAADYYGTRPEHMYECMVSGCGFHVSTLKRFLEGLGELSKQEFVTYFDKGVEFYFVAYP